MPKNTAKSEPSVDEVIEQSKEEFDLEERLLQDVETRLSNRKMRGDVITTYTDEPTGEILGGVARDLDVLGQVSNVSRWGILGEVDVHKSAIEALEKLEQTEEVKTAIKARKADIAKLKKQALPLIKKLESTSFAFELTALPPFIRDATKRTARKYMKIKTKNIPEDRLDEYSDVYTAHMLASSTVSWEDRATGETHASLSPRMALSFKRLLPESEFEKLDKKLGDLQWRKVISDSVTADADF